MTIREKIAVLLAYEDGEQIMFRKGDNEPWRHISNPEFNFAKCQYRIAGYEEQLDKRDIIFSDVPYGDEYANNEELEADKKKHGPFVMLHATFGKMYGEVKREEDGKYFISCWDYGITFKKTQRENCRWQDGTPFGKLVDEL